MWLATSKMPQSYLSDSLSISPDIVTQRVSLSPPKAHVVLTSERGSAPQFHTLLSTAYWMTSWNILDLFTGRGGGGQREWKRKRIRAVFVDPGVQRNQASQWQNWTGNWVVLRHGDNWFQMVIRNIWTVSSPNVLQLPLQRQMFNGLSFAANLNVTVNMQTNWSSPLDRCLTSS